MDVNILKNKLRSAGYTPEALSAREVAALAKGFLTEELDELKRREPSLKQLWTASRSESKRATARDKAKAKEECAAGKKLAMEACNDGRKAVSQKAKSRLEEDRATQEAARKARKEDRAERRQSARKAAKAVVKESRQQRSSKKPNKNLETKPAIQREIEQEARSLGLTIAGMPRPQRRQTAARYRQEAEGWLQRAKTEQRKPQPAQDPRYETKAMDTARRNLRNAATHTAEEEGTFAILGGAPNWEHGEAVPTYKRRLLDWLKQGRDLKAKLDEERREQERQRAEVQGSLFKI